MAQSDFILSESEYKERLREEIKYYREHSREKIVHTKFNEYEMTGFNEGLFWLDSKKDVYDSLDEDQIEEYINYRYISYINRNEIRDFKYSFDHDEFWKINNTVGKVYSMSPDDLKLKQVIKRNLKMCAEVIKDQPLDFAKAQTFLLGLVGVGGPAALTSAVALVSKDPSVFSQLPNFISIFVAGSIAAEIAVFGYNSLSEWLENVKTVDYLKKLGLYDKVIKIAEAEKEMKKIVDKGRSR